MASTGMCPLLGAGGFEQTNQALKKQLVQLNILFSFSLFELK
jgi:hypothetical protein